MTGRGTVRGRRGFLALLPFFSLDRCEAPGAGAFETNITQERVRKSMKLNGGFR